MLVSFDGNNKIIQLLESTGVLDVRVDLYSKWKIWSQQASNLTFDPAFRTVGGDDIDAANKIPSYYYLMNGWRVKFLEENTSIQVNGFLLVDGGGDSPYLPMTGTSSVLLNSVVALNTPLTAEEFWKYQERTLTQNVLADVDLSGIPMDVWSYVSRSLTEEVELLPSQSAKIDQILAKISSTLDANIKYVNDITVTSVDDFKADVSGISLNVNPADIWNYTNRTLSVPSGLTSEQELLLTNINTNILNVPTNVWNFSTRDLTTDLSSQLVSLPESVWSYTNRSLTSEVNIESTLKTHLLGLTNYDDTALKTQITSVLNKGLDIETKVDAIDVIVKSIPELSEIRNELIDVQFGALEIKNNQMIIKDRHDNIISIFNLFDNNGNPTMSAVYKREVV